MAYCLKNIVFLCGCNYYTRNDNRKDINISLRFFQNIGNDIVKLNSLFPINFRSFFPYISPILQSAYIKKNIVNAEKIMEYIKKSPANS